MSSRGKLICCCVSGSLLLMYLTALGGHAGEHQNKAQAPNSDKLRELLEERYEILKTSVQAEEKLLNVGQSSSGRLAKTTAAMLRAEADLCTTDLARITIHQKIVAILRKLEAAAVREADAGYASVGDVAKAKLRRLKAEIKLEKMKLAQQTSQ